MGNVYADLKHGLEETIEIGENRTPNKIIEEKEYLDHKMYGYIDKSKKRRVVLVYSRNNLSKAHFSRSCNQEWKLNGKYEENGIKVEYLITVQGDFKNLFLIKDKQIKVKGGINHFGITVKRKGDKIPWELRKSYENVTVYIKCTGSYVNIRRRRKNIYKTCMSVNIGHRPLEIYSGNSWRALHPYGGGCVRPR